MRLSPRTRAAGCPARPLALAALTVTALLLASGCGSSPPGPRSSPTKTAAQGDPRGGTKITIKTQSLRGVGKVLVTAKGYALYMFEPDHHRSVTCTGVCAGTWPPVTLPSGASVVAGPGVNASLIGSDPDPGGGRVVTYDGWPLYTYTGDVQPGQATGQDIDLNGGDWYVLRPSGAPLIPTP